MRIRCAFALAAVLGVAGCGADEGHPSRERPPTSINVTAAIADGRINVSPRRFGAGPVRLIVSNQTRSAQSLTFETAGDDSGVTQTSAPITPSGGTGTLEVDVAEGDYEITASDDETSAPRRASAHGGASAQNELLLP